MVRIPLAERLLAPNPGWTEQTDVVIIGSGVAGLTAALSVRERGNQVLIITKDVLTSSSSIWAQGGIAAALSAEDSPEEHLADTLVAGAGMCDARAVRDLVMQGPSAVRRLIERGAVFDRDATGAIALGREGGHQRRRIAHAGGDATGQEIIRALISTVVNDPAIKIIEHAVALDLMKNRSGQVVGTTVHVIGEGRTDGVGAVLGRAVVLATGGIGAVFAQTTNPLVASGDGIAIALRAGAAIADLEFVQFHPTVLWLGENSKGRQPLVTEAVRGEGATLLTLEKQPLMLGAHPLADLAPRDVVAKAIASYMRRASAPHVWLDARSLGKHAWQEHFPNVLRACLEHGVDPVTDLIPVVPAAHYASGGVIADMYGRTSVPGLYAVGECACTGVHGANRLASNSLLEGLVVAERLGAVTARAANFSQPARHESGSWADNISRSKAGASVLAPEVFSEVTRITTDCAGLVRSAQGLREGLSELEELRSKTISTPSLEAWGATNVHTVATALLTAALTRQESRGSHWREDFPAVDDSRWRVRISERLLGGEVVTDLASIGTSVFSNETEELMQQAGLSTPAMGALIESAIAEDVPSGIDVTSESIIPAAHRSTLKLVARQGGVICGVPMAAATFDFCAALKGGTCSFEILVNDGATVTAGQTIMSVTGNTRALLMAERTALNFLGHLSGVATVTRSWVEALAGTTTRVRDTRKTTPGLRHLEKYAVRTGGGFNHRMDLSDAILIKDNHVSAAGGVVNALELARANAPHLPIQIEVDDLEGLSAALSARADEILLDNFDLASISSAVEIRNLFRAADATLDGPIDDNKSNQIRLEASGGLTLKDAAAIGATGVDFVAVGSLTHSAPNFDVGADYE